MKRLELLGAILAALPTVFLFAWGGTIICNYVLREFFGPAAPQPSILGWAGFWIIGFIIANMHIDVPWQKIANFFDRERDYV